MCGIAGFSANNISDKKSLLQSMLGVLDHRGPDGQGHYISDEIGLGHKRLAILDLSTSGINPLYSEDNRYCIVYNGEVYNYRELRDQLKHNFHFKTGTDTEVVLNAYIQWGEKCVEHFIGMFSFVIWDSHLKVLYGARDRFGIKPFYYYQEKGGFFFASEIKSLLRSGIKAEPNQDVIYQYLNEARYDHSVDTFFSGVKKLMPAHFFTFENNHLKIKKYWDLADFESSEELSENQLKDLTRDTLNSAVDFALRSDVNVGVNISGGLDSSVLLSLVNNNWNNNYNLMGFTQDYSQSKYSERRWVEEITKAVGKQTHFCETTPEQVRNNAWSMLGYQDEPYAGVPVIGYVGLYQETQKRGVKVLLDGNGLDEAFGGYQSYHQIYMQDYLKNNPGQESAIKKQYFKEWGVALKGSPSEKSAKGGMHQDRSVPARPEWMNRDFIKSVRLPKQERQTFMHSNVKDQMYQDLCLYKVPRALRFNDRVSMAYSRELRVPFLDHRLFEFSFSLSENMIFQNQRPKGLLRSALSDSLPARIVNAPKRQIQTPQSDWLNGELRGWVQDFLYSDSFKNRGIFDVDKVKKDFESFRNKTLANSFFIWQAVNLEMWYRMYIDQKEGFNSENRIPIL